MDLAIIALPTGIVLLCRELNKHPLLRSPRLMASSIALILIGVIMSLSK